MTEPTLQLKVDISRAAAALAEAAISSADIGVTFRGIDGAFAVLRSDAMQEQADFERVVSDIALVAQLPVDVALERFKRYVATVPIDWRASFERIKAGKDDVWAVLRGSIGTEGGTVRFRHTD